MNITAYVRKFGKKTLKEKPFNEVDALIFAELAYINFDILLNGVDNEELILLKNLPLGLMKQLVEGEMCTLANSPLLRELTISERFKDTKVRYVKRTDSLENEKQFFAVTFKLPNGDYYISFRGTDLTLLGWKEDFNLSFLKEIPAQKDALDYVSEVTRKIKGKFYLGGHSKGGNISFYSAIKMPDELFKNLITAYSFDGPGFRSGVFTMDEFNARKNKMVKIVPSESVVGILLNHQIKKIVDAHSLSIFQHDPFNWRIKQNGEFYYLDRRHISSYINEKTMCDWLNSMNEEDTKMTANAVFTMLGGDISKTLSYLVSHFPSTIKKFITASQSFNDEEKAKLKHNLMTLFKYHKEAKKYFKGQQKALNYENQSK